MKKRLPPGKQEFSTIEAGEILGISRIAVFKKIKSGRIEAKKIGRNYSIPRETLEAELGHTLTSKQEKEIKTAVNKAVSEYRDVFERLANE